MHDAESFAGFLGNAEDWRIVERICALDNPQFEPGVERIPDEVIVGFRNFELFCVDWIVVFEMDFVKEALGTAQIVIVQ